MMCPKLLRAGRSLPNESSPNVLTYRPPLADCRDAENPGQPEGWLWQRWEKGKAPAETVRDSITLTDLRSELRVLASSLNE